MQPNLKDCSLYHIQKNILMKKISRIILILSLLLSIDTKAQMVIDNTQNAIDLVNNVLLGNGVSASNIIYSGSAGQIGYFDGVNSNIGLNSGIVMSSGNVSQIAPGGTVSANLNGPGDADILATAQSVTSNPASGNITTTHDAAILSFDFTPIGDTVKFVFVFASEEYLTYINTQYNDAFGFYLSGNNPAGGTYNVQNMAIVPGTSEPITISTIHPSLNSQYYIGTPVGHEFNGFTTTLEIAFAVNCGETYHFKFGVADCQDGILDTGVFLKANSFSSDAVNVAVATVTGDTIVYEGCTSAEIIFSRPLSQIGTTLVVNYDIGGTAATDGTDYPLLVNPVTFLPGEDTVILNLNPISDGISEGLESVIITAYTISPCGDTIETSGTIWILDEPTIDILESDTSLFCMDDSVLVTAFASGGFGPYSYNWSNGAPDNDTAYVEALIMQGSIEYYVTATDQCGYSLTDTITVDINQTLVVTSTSSGPTSACAPDGWVSAATDGITNLIGQELNHWTGPGNPGGNNIDATVMQDIPSGWYYFTVTDDVCTASDSVFVDILNPPIANLEANSTAGCSPFAVSFTNSSENTSSYLWDFGDGTSFNVNNLDAQNHTFTSSSQVMLVAYDGNNCSDTAYVDISVVSCGCTDPSADNYDPNAVQNNGSCIYPVPTVVAPNVLTANNDGQNDIFFLTTEKTVQLELIIVNRWGNIMYDQTIDVLVTPNAGWDGTLPNGDEAGEGTYFYRYIATGVNGDKVEGHGFVQLVRD